MEDILMVRGRGTSRQFLVTQLRGFKMI